MENKRGMQWLFIAIPFLVLAVYLCPRNAEARPASTALRTLSQADDSTFIARQWGDEFYHGWETEDGYTIVKDEETNDWMYAIHDEKGNLVSSGAVVGKDAVPEGVSKHLRLQNSALEKMKRKRVKRRILQKSIVPPTGTGMLPVILVNFNDTATSYTPEQFSAMLFGTGNMSMNDYYKEVSYGNYGINGEVAGWFTAVNTHDYYGADDPNVKDNTDLHVQELVSEAVQAADKTVDFSKYDLDGDCVVDAVAIVHQGTDQANTGISTDIWSHQGSLEGGAQGVYTTQSLCKDGTSHITVNKYFIQNETAQENGPMHMATIGVYVHEFGHALGLPDFYDTDYSSNGLGQWDAMAGGLNTTNVAEDTPAHFNAWSKYKLGWVSPKKVTGTQDVTIQQASAMPDIYQLGEGNESSGEYFLVENRQKNSFDSGLPGDGLMVWHVDASLTTEKIADNTVTKNECIPPADCSKTHYGVVLVQADNKWDLESKTNSGDGGDPFPGSTGNNSFAPTTTQPNSKLYSGSDSGASVTGISTSGATMTATLTTPTPGNQGVTLAAGSGWSLLSSAVNVEVAAHFADQQQFISLWKWEGNAWSVYLAGEATPGTYAASKGYTQLANIAPGQGFWVNSKTDYQLTVTGQPVYGSLALTTGWNLVGLKSTLPSAAGEIANSEQGIVSLWKWVVTGGQGGWQVYLSSEGANQGAFATSKGFTVLTTIQPGEGFWVNKL